MPVLGTKLHLPSPRRRLVPRARLTDQLRADASVGTRLVLVAAFRVAARRSAGDRLGRGVGRPKR
jgi:hypothetical protein